jgi:hypothetical protein
MINHMFSPTILAMFGLGPTESLIVAITLALSAFWVWMLVDCAKRISSGDSKQVGWLIAIALTHWVGALAYFFFGRRSSAPAHT